MPAIRVSDADVDAEARRRDIDPATLDARDRQHIKRDLAQSQVDAHTPPAAPAAEGPDHLTVTVEITHGDRVLGVNQQHIPLPTR
ncbi:hypothetical protein NYO98_10445 [Nocardioides sp. STR2]|uniref:Uncharacterized protein n=1 Tax=Nocardioides pini TaxID=2975053 RepID=A0ABT4CCL1_9ACTN|nr:protealysin inhibitor emfourin [Nocardioides pini]MCY4726697.1 hypothetical protein [Nocardioides pini]